MVVLSHFRVPSDSGESVGTVKTNTSSCLTGGLAEKAGMRCRPGGTLARQTAYPYRCHSWARRLACSSTQFHRGTMLFCAIFACPAGVIPVPGPRDLAHAEITC